MDKNNSLMIYKRRLGRVKLVNREKWVQGLPIRFNTFEVIYGEDKDK